jgi:sugar lactone lactonase YvrE
MVVSPDGRAYAGGLADMWSMLADNPGSTVYDLEYPPEHLHLIEAGQAGEGGRSRVVASDIHGPNGAVITPDGSRLIIAESNEKRLLTFDLEQDGSLTNRQVWADLGSLGHPDGICLDAQEFVWVAIVSPRGAYGFYRVAKGGEISERFTTDRHAVAVALGGPDGRDIFMCEASVAELDQPEVHVRGNSRVMVGKVEVPGAGFA